MFKKIIYRLDFFLATSLSIVGLLSYWRVTSMYFWLDDYTTLYHLQKGVLLPFPYTIPALLTRLTIPVFGLEPRGYFTIGLTIWVLACFVMFYLTRKVFNNSFVSFFVSLVFASGYVGQNEIKMFVSEGFGTVFAIVFMILGLTSFLNYLKNRNHRSLAVSMVFYFLTLEFAPHRLAGFSIALVAATWILSNNLSIRKRITTSLILLVIFFVEYILRPTQFIYNYFWKILDFDPNFLKSIEGIFSVSIFTPDHIDFLSVLKLKPFLLGLADFWSLIVPYDYIHTGIFGINLQTFAAKQYYMFVIPTFVFILILVLYKLMVGESLSKKKFFLSILPVTIYGVFSFFVYHGLHLVDYQKLAVVSGGQMLIFFITLLFLKIPSNSRLSVFSLIFVSVMLGLYPMSSFEFMLQTSYRYLISGLVALPFLISFFVTNEMSSKVLKTRLFAWLIFLIPTGFVIISHLSANLDSQAYFVDMYSLPARDFYSELKTIIPNIKTKTLIYIEGGTLEDTLSVGNATTVGQLDSPASVAVHYKVDKNLVLLPLTSANLTKDLKDNPEIDYDNIYYLVYKNNSLIDLSQGFKDAMSGKTMWKMDDKDWLAETDKYIFIPKKVVSSQVPLLWKFSLSSPINNMVSAKVRISWEYDTIGNLYTVKDATVDLPLDGKFHDFEIVIPNGGQFLKRIDVYYKPLDRMELKVINFGKLG